MDPDFVPTVEHRARFSLRVVDVWLDIAVTPSPKLYAIAPRLAVAHAQVRAEEVERRKLNDAIYPRRIGYAPGPQDPCAAAAFRAAWATYQRDMMRRLEAERARHLFGAGAVPRPQEL